MEFQQENPLKIILIGDTGVGKTNIVTQFVKNQFLDNSRPTIGVEFFQKELTVNISEEKSKGKTFYLQIWDTAGQERFRGLSSSYYRKASGVILIYDVTNRKTFKSLDRWMQEIQTYSDLDIQVVLVGNKVDLIDQREVQTDEGVKYGVDNNCYFQELSAKDDQDKNIEQLFKTITRQIYTQSLQQKNKDNTPLLRRNQSEEMKIEQEQKKYKKNSCCQQSKQQFQQQKQSTSIIINTRFNLIFNAYFLSNINKIIQFIKLNKFFCLSFKQSMSLIMKNIYEPISNKTKIHKQFYDRLGIQKRVNSSKLQKTQLGFLLI